MIESAYLSEMYIGLVNADGSVTGPTLAGGPATPSVGYHTFLRGPSQKFLYALSNGPAGVFSYAITAKNSQPTAVAQSLAYVKFSTSLLNSISIDKGGKLLFVVDNPLMVGATDMLEEFSVNDATGALVYVASVSEEGDLRESVVTPDDKFVYVSDISGSQLYGFVIGSAGSLSPIPGSPFKVGPGYPARITMDSSGRFLYCVLDQGGVEGFAIDPSSGALTVVNGSPFPTGPAPSGIVVAPSSEFIYVSYGDGINAFQIADSGALTPVGGSPFTTPPYSEGPVIDSSGRFLYLAVWNTNQIYAFNIDPSGTLAPLPGAPFPAMQHPEELLPLNVP